MGSFAGISSQLQAAGPLHKATARGNTAEMRRLLDAGADPNGIDRLGGKPLHYASTPETVDLLCSRGANINGLDRKGNSTPLRIAVSSKCPNLELIKQLLRKGANKNIEDVTGTTPIIAVQTAMEGGIVNSGLYTSTPIGDDARRTYAEVLKLFFLPQHLWQ
ncbi:MAG: ankyrin repeat domain-containing protein [Bacteroidales bacterium]|nr:ankyrin repeat domain-containing protein [Bacteroidales bacterium]